MRKQRTIHGIPRAKLMLVIVLGIALVLSLILGSCLNRKHAAGADDAQQSGSPVLVSEIMLSNPGSVTDPNGGHPDYVELYNNSDADIDISGYTLSDREDKAWLFPTGTVIKAREYMIIWCTGDSVNDALIANFKLGSGDVLRFTDASGHLILSKELSDIFAGQVLALNTVTMQWEQMLPSPGYPNTPDGIAAFENSKMLSNEPVQSGVTAHNGVYISEFMPSNGITTAGPDGSYPDWIELYNSNTASVDLSGCGLSDDESKPYKFTFPQGTVIEGGEYLVLWCCTGDAEGFIYLNFALSSKGETLLFTDANGGTLDKVSYESALKDYSFARAYNELGDFDPNSSFGQTDKPTPGYPNTVAGFNAFDSQRNPNLGVHDISFNEILSEGYSWYLNADQKNAPWDRDLGSWIELYNSSDEAVNLTGYSLSDSVNNPTKWVFPDGTSIAGKGYLILNMKGSLPREGETESSVTAEMKALTLSFSVSGEGETLYLYNREGVLIDRVNVPEATACLSYAKNANGDWGFSETPTEGAANTGVLNSRTYCEMPVFSLGSGLYHGTQSMTISVPVGCYVTYTLDATTPTESSARYQAGQTFTLSENTVIRARTFSTDGSGYKSEVSSATYIIIGDTETQEAHSTTLPVVFLVTDPDNLYDLDYGIYVLGNRYKGTLPASGIEETGSKHYQGANFNQRGKEWERQAHMTYTTPGGESVEYTQNLMIRIFGSYSRYDRMKGIALIARKGYGGSTINYPFFENRPFTEYKSLVLRASAKDWNLSRIRDVLILGLADDADIDMAVQAYVQTVVYINGQYWGVYNLREKVSRNYLAQHYSIQDKDTIDILRGNGVYVSGDEGAVDDYKALIQYCQDHNCDLSDPNAYAYVCSQVDVENFAMYCALEIIVGNTDTGNIKFWRSSEKDSRWRWLPYDFDWAMNRNDNESETTTTGYRRDFFYKYLREEGHGAGKGFSTVLARSLLQNNEFVEIFLKYCGVMFKDVYSTEKIVAKANELADNIDAEIQWDFPRWGLTLRYWRGHINNIIGYAENYPAYYLKYCKAYINKYTNYKLTDEKMIEIFGRAE